MAIIQLSTGSVFLFADGDVGVQQIAGTEDVFVRNILNELNARPSGSVTISTGASLNVRGSMTLGSGTNTGAIGGAILYTKYSDVNPASIPTSSITNIAELLATGSFIRSRGTVNHMLRIGNLGSTYNGLNINYLKASNNTSTLIMISGSTNSISGQTQWSSSDAYASINLVYHNLGNWVITSKVGNWY